VGIKKGSIMKNWKDNEKSSDTIFDNISNFKSQLIKAVCRIKKWLNVSKYVKVLANINQRIYGCCLIR
jgi:hypothetical protein